MRSSICAGDGRAAHHRLRPSLRAAQCAGRRRAAVAAQAHCLRCRAGRPRSHAAATPARAPAAFAASATATAFFISIRGRGPRTGSTAKGASQNGHPWDSRPTPAPRRVPTGGLFGLIGNVATKVVGYFETKQQFTQKQAAWAHETDLLNMQMQARQAKRPKRDRPGRRRPVRMVGPHRQPAGRNRHRRDLSLGECRARAGAPGAHLRPGRAFCARPSSP